MRVTLIFPDCLNPDNRLHLACINNKSSYNVNTATALLWRLTGSSDVLSSWRRRARCGRGRCWPGWGWSGTAARRRSRGSAPRSGKQEQQLLNETGGLVVWSEFCFEGKAELSCAAPTGPPRQSWLRWSLRWQGITGVTMITRSSAPARHFDTIFKWEPEPTLLPAKYLQNNQIQNSN